MSKEICNNVSFFIKFAYDLEYFTTVLWFISFMSTSVCRYHCFHAITFVQDKFKDTKGVTSTRIYKHRQCNGQKKKRTNHDLQNTTQKPKDWETRTLLQTSSAPLVAPVVLLLLQITVTSHESREDWIVITTKGTYLWSFATHTFCNGYQSHDGDGKTFRSDNFLLVILLSSLGLPFSIFNFT